MRTIRIRVVIDIRIGIIRGVVVRVGTLVAAGRVMAVAGPGILMVGRAILVVMDVQVPGVLTAVAGRAIRVMVVPVMVLAGRPLVITKRGVV